jgi:cysteine synthase
MHRNVLGTIGKTPTIRLAALDGGSGSRIFAKLEFFSPGRSVKDRIALGIIEAAEKRCELPPNAVIIESSSGNTGIGLSIVCRVKGYLNVVVVDQNCPIEKLRVLQALGARIVIVRSDRDTGADLTQLRIALIQELRKHIGSSFVPNQYQNPDAPRAHYEGTGAEIVAFAEEHRLRLSCVVISVGTGGTVSGVSKRLKEFDSTIEVVGVEPCGSTLFGGEKGPYLQQGPGNYFIPDNLIFENIDRGLKVSDQDAFTMCRRVARSEGLLVGGSSGAVLVAAQRISEANYEGDIICILPDGGEKYLETVYNDAWLRSNGIMLEPELMSSIIEVKVDEPVDYDSLARQLESATGHAE